MIKQTNNFSPRKISGVTARVMLSRRVLAGVAAILMSASFIFSGNVSAHNIDLEAARNAARRYARQVRDQSAGKYQHFSTNCENAFPGHNHIVRCQIDYQHESFTKSTAYTCREFIEIKVPPHGSIFNPVKSGFLYGSHTTAPCGGVKLNGTRMD